MAIPHFPDLERRILQEWKAKDIFGQTLKKPAPRGRFVFYDGPPTANGMPHIGHVETRVFKDIIPRFKTMQGFFVERKAGWDTQGLPVEIEVEKALGISGKKDIEKYGVAEFNAKAKESVWKYKAEWEKMTERIGYWLDLDRPYITYSNDYIETLWWIYKEVWDQKLLERDFKVVPYCPRCGTALSSHEVAQGYKKVKEPAVYVKFELVDEPGTFVLAWTTTPWTLPGNVALAVDANITYMKTAPNGDGERYILAQGMESKALTKEDHSAIDMQGEGVEFVKGEKLVGKKYIPLFDFVDLRKVKTNRIPEVAAEGSLKGKGPSAKETPRDARGYEIVAADFVTTEDGTGVVHTAVMYGVEDFELGRNIGLPKVHTVDETGRFNELVKPWVGKKVKDTDKAVENETTKAIVDYLRGHNLLYRIDDEHEHDYPFCWRCKHPLLYYAKTSWFIRMSKLRDRLIANNEKINWYPKHIKDGRFGEWLREVKDWAISRERYWGTPLPIWLCDQCDHREAFGSFGDLAKRVTAKNTYIVARHGQSTNNVAQTLDTLLEDGTAALTPAGEKQARQAGQKLKSRGVTKIYTSQFLRAQKTAEIIAQELGLLVETAVAVNEYRIGPRYEGQAVAEFHKRFGARSSRIHTAPEGGETWLDIQHRFIHFLKELETKHDGQTILIVTHADPILVAQWATQFKPESAIEQMKYPENGQAAQLHFPAALFNDHGEFDPHRPYIDGVTLACPKCHQGTMRRTPEVGDTWFDSGAMPFAQAHYPFEGRERIDQGDNYPADYISEAIDQTRGWFYTLLAIGTLLQKAKIVKEGPYKNVVVLGHIHDAQGRKLAKSAGNYFDPMDVIDKYGADAIRWFMYTVNQPWDSKSFDPAVVEEGIRKTFLILLNVVSFWELYRGDQATPSPAKHILDRWLVSRTNALVHEVTDRLERYDITGAGRQIAEFITELSTWYVRRSRDRMKGEDQAVVSAHLQQALMTLTKLLAPFIPFLSEDLYRRAGGTKASVHLEDWPGGGEVDERLLADMSLARNVVEEALSLRAQAGIKVRQPLQQLVVTTALHPDLDEVVRDELNVKELHATEKLPSGGDWVVGAKTALDRTISDELRYEGYLRDIVREVNALRKEAGLSPADKIIVHVPSDSLAAKIIERWQEQFLTDVRARGATPSLDGATTTTTIKLETETEIGISKV